MFGPICGAISRLIFEQVECTIDNAFNLRDLVLQELVKIIMVYFTLEIRMCQFYTISIKTDKIKLTVWL
jgi:hypothetical protein